jgi:N-acetylglucosaminyl-diphospho-decaprenol L-rhamnosyltransferase
MNLEQLDIVLLNYRNADLTIETARLTLEAAPGAALYVVDNGSGDGSYERLKGALPAATVVDNDQNAGFGGGMNRGIREGKRPFVLVQANDTRPVGDAYRVLLARCAAEPRMGAVTPQAGEPDGRALPHFWPEPPAWRLVAELLPGVWRVHARFANRQYQRIDWLNNFCATIFRRQALEEVGAFDPGYFLGWEEWDLTRRLRGAGWMMAHEPGARFFHAAAANHAHNSGARRMRIGRQGLLHHLEKYHGRGWSLAGRLASQMTDAWLRLGSRTH